MDCPGHTLRAGIIGHLGVDFVAHREDGLLRLWAVDLNIACTSTLARCTPSSHLTLLLTRQYQQTTHSFPFEHEHICLPLYLCM
eukprot:scaffold51984_cov36-Prasinocladus_malaysianus.AAC.1